MTCIAALVQDGEVWMGADSYIGAGTVRMSNESKLFRIHNKELNMLIGSTGSSRIAQIMKYHLKLPDVTLEIDPLRYMVTEFIPAYRKCLEDNGSLERDKEVDDGNNNFVVAFDNSLFYIDPAFHIHKTSDGFCCAGSGEAYAYGALYATDGNAPYDRIIAALKAASRFCGSVREPFNIETLSGNVKMSELKG